MTKTNLEGNVNVYTNKKIEISLTQKLILSYIFIVLIPIIIGGIYFINFSNDAYRKELSTVLENNLVQINWNIQSIIEACKKNAVILRRNSKLLDLLQTSIETNDINIVNTLVNDINPSINAILDQNGNINSIKIIHGNPRIQDFYHVMEYDPGITDGKWAAGQKKLKLNGILWSEDFLIDNLHNNDYYIMLPPDKREKMFRIYCPIYSWNLDKVLGVIRIEILGSVLLRPLNQLKLEDSGIVNLVNDDGEVVYSSKAQFTGAGIDEIRNGTENTKVKINNVTYLFAKKYVASMNSWVIFYIPDTFLSSRSSFKMAIALVLVIGLSTLGIIAFFLSKLILGKLTKLSRAMDQIKRGNLQTRVTIHSVDEIGSLAGDFNNMAEKN